jgi:hypothetical protein
MRFSDLIKEESEVQSIMFDKNLFSKEDSIKWAKEHGFNPIKEPETSEEGEYVHLRIQNPEKYKTFRVSQYPEQKLPKGIKLKFGII